MSWGEVVAIGVLLAVLVQFVGLSIAGAVFAALGLIGIGIARGYRADTKALRDQYDGPDPNEDPS